MFMTVYIIPDIFEVLNKFYEVKINSITAFVQNSPV